MHNRYVTTVLLATLVLLQTTLSAQDLLVVSLQYLGTMNSNDLTDTVFHEGTVSQTGQFTHLKGRSSVQSLGLDIDAQSLSTSAAPINAQNALNAHIIFESDPEITTATVSWDARVVGTVSGELTDNIFNTGAQVSASLHINNNIVAAMNETYELELDGPPIDVDVTIVAAGQVPTNVPIPIAAYFGAGTYNMRDFDTIHVDFYNSMSFDPDSFFDIQTAGVTVRSVGSDWLVNNQVTVNNIPPQEFSAFRGSFSSGSLEDVLQSDDNDLCYNAGIVVTQFEAPITLDFVGTLPSDSPSTVDFTIESSADTAGLEITVQFWNFNSGQWETVGTDTQSSSVDTIRSFPGNPSDHVQVSTGEVRARYEVRQVSVVLMFPWTDCVDQVFWNYTN